jgi:hypothetical protein
MKIARIVGYSLLIVVAIAFVAGLLSVGIHPFIGPRTRPVRNRLFDRTPGRLARGKYLVENVAACMECHSPHDFTKRDLPTPAGMIAAGQHFPVKGLPGNVVAANLTPDPETGLGRWTDDEIGRAIREGVDRRGQALFPLMPYERYRHLSDEDLASVVVYLRALPPVRNSLPPSTIVFPVKYLIRNAPQPVTSVAEPDLSTRVSRGKYLVEIGGCTDCHTPARRGQPLPGLDFAGGFVIEGPWGRVTSANITPDPSGISYYDEPLFIEVMRTGYVHARPLSQIMPWQWYAGMTDQDLTAMFAYLRTVHPAHHRVDNDQPPSLCRLCKASHGAGDQN